MTAMLVCFPAAERIAVVDDIIDGMFEGLLGDDASDAGSVVSRRRSSLGSAASPTEKRGRGLRFLRKSSTASVDSKTPAAAAAAEGVDVAEGGQGAADRAAKAEENDAEQDAAATDAAMDDLLAELDAEEQQQQQQPTAADTSAEAAAEEMLASIKRSLSSQETPAEVMQEAAASGWSTPRASVSDAADDGAADATVAEPEARDRASDGAPETPSKDSRRLSELLNEAEVLLGTDAAEGEAEAEVDSSPADDASPEAASAPALEPKETAEEAAARRKKEEAEEAAEMARLAKLTMGRQKSKRARPQLQDVFKLAGADDDDAEA